MSEKELEIEEDKTEERFAQCSESCFHAYQAWEAEQLCSEKRDLLRKSLHAMRKVLARVEIEMALSESKERAKNPMPIPTHRTKNKKDGKPLEVSDDVKKRIKARKKAEAELDDVEMPQPDTGSENDLPGFLTGDGAPAADDAKKKRPRSSQQRRPRTNNGGQRGKKNKDENGAKE